MPYRSLLRQYRTPYISSKQVELSTYWPIRAAGLNSALWDSGGGVKNLTAVNTPTSVAGPGNNIPIGTGFASASSQEMTATPTSQVFMGLQKRGFSCQVWVLFATVPGTVMGLFGEDVGPASNNWRLIKNASNALQFLASNGTTTIGGVTGATVVTTATWYHVIARCTNAKSEIFINGALDGIASESYSSEWGSGNSNNLRLGNDPIAGGRFLNGRLAQAALWHRPLTNMEILWLYNNGQGRDLERGV